MTPAFSILTGLALITLAAAPANAQRLVLSGGVQRDTQRFPDEGVPARLSGSATGWTVGGAAVVRGHLALAVEWSEAGTIEDVRQTTLDIDDREVAITSTFRHRTRSAAVLGGFSHMLSSRVRIAYLAGVAFTNVRRQFESNAPGLVLVGPSDPAASGQSARVDRLHEVTGGADAWVRMTGRLHLVVGMRAQKVGLPLEVSGWSVRTIVGAGWSL